MGQSKLTIDRVKDMKKHGMLGDDNGLLLPDGIGLRDAKKTDIDQLFEWSLATIPKEQRDKDKIIDMERNDIKDNLKYIKVIVDNVTGKDIGMYEAYPTKWNTGRPVKNGDWFYLDKIFIVAEYRGRKIGSTIIKNAIDMHDKLFLGVDKDNTRAKKLYETFGFRVIEEYPYSYVMALDKTKPVQEGYQKLSEELIPCKDYKHDLVYLGSPDKTFKKKDVYFVTPYIGTASIFAAHGAIDSKLHELGLHSYNSAYDEWNAPVSELEEPLSVVHVKIYSYENKSFEPFEMDSSGYIFTIDISNIKDNIFVYPWMTKSREVLIANTQDVNVVNVQKVDVKYIVEPSDVAPDAVQETFYMNPNTFDVVTADKSGEIKFNGDTWFEIDEMMIPLVQLCNNKGYTTTFSCSGHSPMSYHYDTEIKRRSSHKSLGIPYIAFKDIHDFKNLPNGWEYRAFNEDGECALYYNDAPDAFPDDNWNKISTRSKNIMNAINDLCRYFTKLPDISKPVQESFMDEYKDIPYMREHGMLGEDNSTVQESAHDNALIPVRDFKYDKVYYGDPTNGGSVRKLDDKPLFVTPRASLATIFLGRRELFHELSKRGYPKVNLGYDEWNKYESLPPDEPLTEVHVYVRNQPDLEPFTVKYDGYLHTIDCSNLKNNLYRYSWMSEPDQEVLIANVPSVKIDDVQRLGIVYHVRGIEGMEPLSHIQAEYKSKTVQKPTTEFSDLTFDQLLAVTDLILEYDDVLYNDFNDIFMESITEPYNVQEAVPGLWEDYLTQHAGYDSKTHTYIDPKTKKRVQAPFARGTSKEMNRRNAFLKRHNFNPENGTIEIDEIDPSTGQKMRVPVEFIMGSRKLGDIRNSKMSMNPTDGVPYDFVSAKMRLGGTDLMKQRDLTEPWFGHETAHAHQANAIRRQLRTQPHHRQLDDLLAARQRAKESGNYERMYEYDQKVSEYIQAHRTALEKESKQFTLGGWDAVDKLLADDPRYKRATENSKKHNADLSTHDVSPWELHADDYGGRLSSKYTRGKNKMADALQANADPVRNDMIHSARKTLADKGIDASAVSDETIERTVVDKPKSHDVRTQIARENVAADAAKEMQDQKYRRKLAKETLQTQVASRKLTPQQEQKAKKKIAAIDAYDKKTEPTQESFMDEYKSEIFESGDFDKYRDVDKVMLRPATKNDINFIYDCEIETVESDKRNDDTTKREVLQDSKDSVGHTKIIFVDNNPDKRIGIYQGYATNEYGLREGTRDWWYLAEIYIIPEFRNKGIGSAIIKAEIEKHDKIMLNVLDENTKAQRLYESLGFKTTQTYEGHKIMRLVKGETYTEDADIGTMLKVALAANAVKNDDINTAATLSKYTAIPFNRASFEQYREGHGQTQMDMSHLVVRDDKMSGMIYVDKSDMVVCFFVMEQRPDGTKIIISMGTGIDMRMQGLVTCMLKVAQTDYHANLFILNKKYAELIKCVLNSGWTVKNQKPNMVLLEGPAQSDVKTEMYTESYMFTESVHENKKLVFHVSPDAHLDGRVFQPRVPSYIGEYDPEDKCFENSTTPRVCFSTSIDGAINAIIVNMNRQHPNQFDRFYVYIPEKPVGDYKHKTNKEIVRDHDVFDANSTKELWIMEPVRLKLYGVIRIDQVKNVKRVKTVPTQSGKTDTRPYYKYKWHWLIKPKVLDKTPYHYDTMAVCERLEMDITRFRYGLLVDGHLKTKSTDADFNKEWTFHSADEVDRAGGGNCFDFVEYEAHYLESYGVSCKKYFFTATTDDNKLLRTHTIVVVPHDGKFVYIEGAFKRVVDDMGNLRTFDKLDDIFEYVAECMADYENHNINYGVFDYTDETFKEGTPIQNFIDYIITNCDMVHDGHASKPKSNKTKKE